MTLLFQIILNSFGYKNFQDFLNTTVFVKGMLNTIFLISIGLSTLTVFIEDFIGLKPMAYLSLFLLFILEFITGVTASVFIRKERFESLKMGRIVLKIFVYTTILGLFNVFTHKVGGWTVLDFHFNFFEWIYYIVLNVLILQLLVSVLENCEELGFKEVNIFLRIFRKRIKKIEDDLDGEDDKKEDTKE